MSPIPEGVPFITFLLQLQPLEINDQAELDDVLLLSKKMAYLGQSKAFPAEHAGKALAHCQMSDDKIQLWENWVSGHEVNVSCNFQ